MEYVLGIICVGVIGAALGALAVYAMIVLTFANGSR